jgi:hypothetical protein
MAKAKLKMLMGSPCRKVDEGVVDDTEVIGEAPG